MKTPQQKLDDLFVERASDVHGYIGDMGVLRPPILAAKSAVLNYPVSQAGIFPYSTGGVDTEAVILKTATHEHASGDIADIVNSGHYAVSNEFSEWAQQHGYFPSDPLYGLVRPLYRHEPSRGVVFNPKFYLDGLTHADEHFVELSRRIPMLVIYLGESAIYHAGHKARAGERPWQC